MPALPIADGFYRSDSLPLSAQRCVNWEPVVPQTQGLSDKALFDPYGIRQLALTGDSINGANRGAATVAGVPYFINGTNLYSIDADFVVTDHGDIKGSDRVSLAKNSRYLVIVVPNLAAYAFDSQTGTLTDLGPLSGFRTSSTVVYKSSYFVFTAADGSVFFNSAINDPLTYDALDFGSAEINADKIMAGHVNHDELFILGEEITELFQAVSTPDFPFQRIPGANIQKGIHARLSAVEFDNTFLFVGGGQNEESAIWKVASSANAQKVSTAAIDTEIQKFTEAEIAASFGFSYAYRGSFFAAFTFESTRIPSKTFVYDATSSALTETPVWHERQSGTTEGRWRVQSIIKAYGELMVGDSVDGRIGVLDKDVHNEYGDPIYRERASQPFMSDDFPTVLSELELMMEAGTGTISGLGSDPKIRMDFSDDGSRTWTSEFPRSYGKIGQYQKVPTWRALGQIPRDRVLRFKSTEDAKTTILKMIGTAEEGVS